MRNFTEEPPRKHNRTYYYVACVLGYLIGLSVPLSPSATAQEPSDSPRQQQANEAGDVTPGEMQEIFNSLNVSEPLAGAQGETVQAKPLFNVGPFSLDLALILDVAAAWYSVKEPLQTGGHDPQATGFTLQQLELSVESFIDPYLKMDANIVFTEFGVEVEEAYATSLGLPAKLQLRAGQMLTRFGRHNNRHPHSWSFADQPIVIGKLFGSEGSRGLGVELSWLAPLPWYLESVASATLATGECCARSFYGANDLGVEDPLDLLYTLAIKQFFPIDEDWSLSWGLSAQLGPNSTGNGNRTEIFGTDTYLRYRPVADPSRMSVSLDIEALLRSRQVPRDHLLDGGGTAQLKWQITPNWETAARVEWVTGIEDDPMNPEWTLDRMRYAVQGTYYPSHFSRIRLQVSADRLLWLESPIWGAVLSLELVAGSHGAHDF